MMDYAYGSHIKDWIALGSVWGVIFVLLAKGYVANVKKVR